MASSSPSMFSSLQNVQLTGGHYHQQIIYGQPVKKLIDKLYKVSAPSALHTYEHGGLNQPKCHKGTREDVFKWLSDWLLGFIEQQALMMWLYGAAGAGKSAIAYDFAERCASNGLLLGEFFFSKSDASRANIKSFVATIAGQAARSHPSITLDIEKVVYTDPGIFDLRFEHQLERLIIWPLRQLVEASHDTHLPQLLIVDGLDECQDTAVQQRIVTALLSFSQEMNLLGFPVRILIASRPEHHLVAAFNSATPSNALSRIHLDNDYQSSYDFEKFIRDKLQKVKNTSYWDFAVFQVEGTIFRIPTFGSLKSDEGVLHNKFPSVSRSEDPVVDVVGVTKEAFEGFLMTMYPRNGGPRTFGQWLGALHVSTMWDLQGTRLKAIAGLTKHEGFKSKTEVEVICLAKGYRVVQWLHDAYIALIQRKDLSMNMLLQDSNTLQSLDMTTIARIFQAQSCLKIWPEGKAPARAQCALCINQSRGAQTGQRLECYAPVYFCPFHADAATIVKTIFQEDFHQLGDTSDLNPTLAGHRLSLASERDLPDNEQLGQPPCVEHDGSPVFIGSALLGKSIVPCKVHPQASQHAVRYPLNNSEPIHKGRYDLLPYLPDKMEWVTTSGGQIPMDRRPIEGGYEENGDKLYHALACLNTLKVPGKTGEHMNGAKFPYDGEKFVSKNYWIL